MEPNFEDMDDYKKPLSEKKIKLIVLAFAIALAVYAIYAVVMGGF